MKRFLVLFLLSVTALSATTSFGQGASYPGTPIALTRGGFPAAGARVTVCAGNVAVTFNANPPCAPYASIFSDPALSVPIAQPGFTTDGLGNYPFFVTAGATYTVVLDGSGFTGNKTVWNAPCATSSCASVSAPNTWTALQTFSAGLTSSGPNTLNGGGVLGGTYSGNPTLSGTSTISGTFTSSGGTFSGTWLGSPALTNLWTFNGGVTSPVFTSGSANPATAGLLRLASSDTVSWENNAGSSTLGLGKTSTDVLSWAGTPTFVNVASDFTTAANTNLQAITGLVWTIPANQTEVVPFSCHLMYSQATGAVADQFGIQDVSSAPTNIAAKAQAYISASTFTAGNLSTLTTTTATPIVTFTPSATATIWNADIDGLIEQPAGATSVQIMVQTSVAGDAITVKRGSFCRIF